MRLRDFSSRVSSTYASRACVHFWTVFFEWIERNLELLTSFPHHVNKRRKTWVLDEAHCCGYLAYRYRSFCCSRFSGITRSDAVAGTIAPANAGVILATSKGPRFGIVGLGRPATPAACMLLSPMEVSRRPHMTCYAIPQAIGGNW